MLYDAKRERYPTLYRFIAWLRSKPADERYLWSSHMQCACAQFWDKSSQWFEYNAETRRTEGVDLNQLAYGKEPHIDWTFGKLLERAEVQLAKLAELA